MRTHLAPATLWLAGLVGLPGLLAQPADWLTARASGLLTMGLLGGAGMPVLQGRMADAIGLRRSFWVLAVPYSLALFYAVTGHRVTNWK